jgi:hypothetical protein
MEPTTTTSHIPLLSRRSPTQRLLGLDVRYRISWMPLYLAEDCSFRMTYSTAAACFAGRVVLQNRIPGTGARSLTAAAPQ